MNNKIPCKVIQDLLPLYHDGICSPESSALIEEHLTNCQTCSDLLASLRSFELDTQIDTQMHDVLKKHARKSLGRSMIIGIIISVFLILPIIISLLTAPGDLQTSTMLTAAMIFVAGITVVPLMTRKNRFSKATLLATLGIVLMILFDTIFTMKGSSSGEIAVTVLATASAIIFGISLFLAPFVAGQLLPRKYKKYRGCIVMLWDTFWLYMMFLFINTSEGLPLKEEESFRGLMAITYLMIYVWLIFFVIRSHRINRWFKTSLISLITGFFIYIGVELGYVVFIEGSAYHMVFLLISIIVTGITAVIGFLSEKAKR